MNSEKLIEKLTSEISVSGAEYGKESFIYNEISKYTDSISIDPMGNIIACKKSSGKDAKRFMLAAHMDEIGFLVHYIDENGLIKVSGVGGINAVSAAYTNVVFENGVQGVLVAEDNTKNADIAVKKLYVDIGAKNRKEAEKLISIGDRCTVRPNFTKLSGGKISSHALDDKAGCALLIETASRIEDSPYDVYFVFTTQEEVGLRGSATASYSVAPDYGIAVDVTDTGDMPGCDPMEVKLGKGAAIKIKDSSAICSHAMVEYLKKTAVENKIPYQLEILPAGGTDTKSLLMSGSGAIAGAVSIPTRYIHSTVETIDMKDYNACLKLLVRALEGNIDA
ncbi:MAG: M20/M25/M40 family metallo-hydrolase [Clostridia bacterium]|nr:M20/M25/M40 family metallo-hydrolase [Clostridia bacterium]